MPSLNNRQKADIIAIIQRIPDEKVRYFYLMLGSALACQEQAVPDTPRVNSSADHIADIQARYNG